MRRLALIAALFALTACGSFSLTEKTGVPPLVRADTYLGTILMDPAVTPAEAAALVAARQALVIEDAPAE